MEHYLYTIEFLVQNLTITKGNICAPQSYPVNAEFKFRRGLFRINSSNFFALNKGQFYNTLKQRHRDVAGSPATPYPPSGTPKHPEYGSTEAEVEERRTKKLPDENEATFKPEDGQDSFGIHTDPNPIQPDKQANVVFKASIQLRNNRGEGSAFMVVLIRLACMGRTVCTEIPFPKKDGGGAHHRQMSIESKESHKLDPFGESSMDDSGSLEDGRFYSDRPQRSVNVSSSYVSSAGESIPSQPVIKPNVDRAAYDEFEADLNGCGLVIRVLKNAHKVSAVGRPSHPAAGTFTKPENTSNQKSAIARLLSLVCNVLQSVTAEQQTCGADGNSPSLQCASNKPPSFQELCRCITQLIGGDGAQNPDVKPISVYRKNEDCGTRKSKCQPCPNKMSNPFAEAKSSRRRKDDPCKQRFRGGSEYDPQRNIMLFLESIRQVVSNKKGLSDLADLLIQCTCENGIDGGGDNKSGLTNIFKIILEKIKDFADDRPALEKQTDLCGLTKTLIALQNNDGSCCRNRQRGGQNSSCGSDTEQREKYTPTSDNISCLVKKILELGVKYCSNRNIDLRGALCRILSNEDNNQELTNICRTVAQYLETDRNVVCDHMRKETVGRVRNAPVLARSPRKYKISYCYGLQDC
ncbi:unnamed protein product [Hermetia illucens]|uniref:Uncharacterized protein n=1 Tax=Hermetia illucens TaxID=343691 RepID=A0A7R8UKI7_HERIL|nr:unnamed protein product [Hermetia illucens]